MANNQAGDGPEKRIRATAQIRTIKKPIQDLKKK